MKKKPKLKGGSKRRSGPYPLGDIPRDKVVLIGKQLVHRLAIGQTDISGDDFGKMFANAIGGEHLGRPLGIADVIWHDCAWSAKTIKGEKPLTVQGLRFISGRNSPDYSFDISDPRRNIQKTGDAVLSIWNARVDETLNKHKDLREIALLRNMDTREFVLFEDEAKRFIESNYKWELNKNGNMVGIDINTSEHKFTWQPHGAQFTIHRTVPASACKFKIAQSVPMVEFEHVLQSIQYRDDWIEFQP